MTAASADDLERELGLAAMRDELGERVPVHQVGERLRENAVEAEALQLLRSPRVNEELLFVDVGDVLVDHRQCFHGYVPLNAHVLKTRVTDVEDFVDTLKRIVKGASVVDPALVQELVAARGVRDPLDELSPREREVLALMAEGRSNAGIAHTLWITKSTVEKHVRAILRKLRLPAGEDDQRRVLAVVTYLDAR